MMLIHIHVGSLIRLPLDFGFEDVGKKKRLSWFFVDETGNVVISIMPIVL